MKKLSNKLDVQGIEISILSVDGEDYISLTDMAKKVGDETTLYQWMRNRNTVEFLGIWEQLHNRSFKPIEFDRFKRGAGLNNFTLSPKKWIDATGAIGILSKPGRHGGGTFAHKDIAFEFGTWLSPEFKLYLIKEFQRLKEQEKAVEGWNYRRFLSKVNYKIHTDSVKEIRIPVAKISKEKQWLIYAEEADILNVALFEKTNSEWRKENPEAKKNENIRDYASIIELTVLSNLESLNASLLREGKTKTERFAVLRREAILQMTTLAEYEKLRHLNPDDNIRQIE